MEMTSAEHPGDQRSLIESLAAGDERALEDVIARDGPWLRGVVFSVLGDRADADDVMQRIWLRLWERREQLTGVDNWPNWLYTLARNAAVDAARAASRRRGLLQRVKMFRTPDRSAARPADEDLLADERRRRTLRAIEALDEKYRTVLVLRVWRELGYREIARALGITPQAVATRLVRARRMLRAKLMRGEGQ